MISVLVVGYVVFWTPFHAYGVIISLGLYLPKTQCDHLLRIESTYVLRPISNPVHRCNPFSLCLLHSGLNPLIYSFLSYGYRARLLKIWQRLLKNEGAKMGHSSPKSFSFK